VKKVIFFLSGLLVFGAFSLPAYAWSKDHSEFKETAACYECHGYDGISAEVEGEKISLYVDKEVYEQSVHGTVDCVSCHQFGPEAVYGAALQSEVSETCGNCHTGAAFDYDRGVHSESAEAANCVTCHGAHEIVSVNDPLSPVASQNLDETCGSCHKGVVAHYRESFHGKAAALGGENSPDCVACHDSHQILGQDDPVAMTSEGRKPALCAECHAGSGTLGVGDTEHYKLSAKGYGAPMYWVKKAFMWLILLVVGFFLIHILLDLAHRLRARQS